MKSRNEKNPLLDLGLLSIPFQITNKVQSEIRSVLQFVLQEAKYNGLPEKDYYHIEKMTWEHENVIYMRITARPLAYRQQLKLKKRPLCILKQIKLNVLTKIKCLGPSKLVPKISHQPYVFKSFVTGTLLPVK